MKCYKISLYIIGIILLLLRILFKELYVDSTSILLFFMLGIPLASKYLKNAKFLGSEFNFKEEIKQTERHIEETDKKIKRNRNKNVSVLDIESFDLTLTKEILKIDTNVALASLRIEIEKKIRQLGKKMDNDTEFMDLRTLIKNLGSKNLFLKEQLLPIDEVIKICNKAIHAYPVSINEASKIIELVEKLNYVFSKGYSLNLNPANNLDSKGCLYQHCIENMPFSRDSIDKSCPTFGHDCPGGELQVKKCTEEI